MLEAILKLPGHFLQTIQESIDMRKIKPIVYSAFHFAVLLCDDDELFIHFEVLNGKFISSFSCPSIKVQLLQQRPKQEYMAEIAFVTLSTIFSVIFFFRLFSHGILSLYSHPTARE